MTLKSNCGLTALRLLALCELTLSSMVLPRPPSTPIEIQRGASRGGTEKFRNEKASNFLHNTNVEKPNTDGYRLLEIELGFAGDAEERNLRGLVRAMLGKDDKAREENLKWNNVPETYPKPEVRPNSILGVREIALPSNFRTEKLPSFDVNEEKLYYLKNKGPKVDAKSPGNTGNYRKDKIISATMNNEFSMTSQSVNRHEEKSHTDSEIQRPKKYERATSRGKSLNVDNSSSERIYGTSAFEPRPDRANDESTTENTSVTSSELPKQIPAPPSNFPSFFIVAQTTPVQKYSLRRNDIFPGYGYDEV